MRALFREPNELFGHKQYFSGISHVVLVVKNPSANAGDVRNIGSIPESGRSPGGGKMATHSSIPAWRILLTEELGRLHRSP